MKYWAGILVDLINTLDVIERSNRLHEHQKVAYSDAVKVAIDLVCDQIKEED